MSGMVAIKEFENGSVKITKEAYTVLLACTAPKDLTRKYMKYVQISLEEKLIFSTDGRRIVFMNIDVPEDAAKAKVKSGFFELMKSNSEFALHPVKCEFGMLNVRRVIPDYTEEYRIADCMFLGKPESDCGFVYEITRRSGACIQHDFFKPLKEMGNFEVYSNGHTKSLLFKTHFGGYVVMPMGLPDPKHYGKDYRAEKFGSYAGEV